MSFCLITLEKILYDRQYKTKPPLFYSAFREFPVKTERNPLKCHVIIIRCHRNDTENSLVPEEIGFCQLKFIKKIAYV